MLLAILSIFIGGLLAPTVKRFLGHNAGWALAIIPASVFVYFLSLYDKVVAERQILESHEWIGSLGLNMSFALDGLSLMFALLISGIGTFIMIYAGGYLKGHINLGRFFAFMMLFMGSMMGVVLASNLMAIFFFWELTSVTSFLLIGFDHLRARSRRSAIQALVVTGLGGLALLAGFALIYVVTGQIEMANILGTGNEIKDSGYYMPILILIILGTFTKSAQFPFHFWLPNAMEAPTPVSAFLHSATMVKAGVYLLMRMNPVLGDTVEWSMILGPIGAATLLAGTFLAIAQTDLKLMLAYTTMASLGLLVMLIGAGGEGAIEGAILYLFAHSLFKGALFMLVGGIDHETGTRDVTKLGGLRTKMPITFIAALVAALSMGGIIPMVGFVAKESIYYALAKGDQLALILLVAAFIGNAMMFAIGFAVALKPMLGKLGDMPKIPHEGPISLWLGAAVLGVIGIGSGLFIATLGAGIFKSAISTVYGHASGTELHLWHGFNIALYLSLATMALGGLMYFFYDQLRGAFQAILKAIGWGPDHGFDQFLAALLWLSQKFTAFMQNGNLTSYMRVTFISFAAVIWVPMIITGNFPVIDWSTLRLPTFYESGILLIAVVGLYAVLIARSRLTSIVSLGILGFAVAILFMLFGAPDLSFTQFMVETLSVIILALVMTRLKLDMGDRKNGADRIISAMIAAFVGAGMTAILLKVLEADLNLDLSTFFTTYSKAIAHGHNIVNVILVDFRALDTLGEISVVMTTGVVVLALIKFKPKNFKHESQLDDKPDYEAKAGE